MKMHDCTTFGESLGQFKFQETIKDKLYNHLCNENVEINSSFSPLELPSDFDGLQQDFNPHFVPLHANNAHVF
jgi:hypothetical protein